MTNQKLELSAKEVSLSCEDSKLIHRQKRPKVDPSIFFSFFRRVRATSMTQRRVENTRVHFWTFSPVSVNIYLILVKNGLLKQMADKWLNYFGKN